MVLTKPFSITEVRQIPGFIFVTILDLYKYWLVLW